MATLKASTFAIPINQRADQKLQKSLLCPPGKKNKKSPPFKKNETLPTHNPTDKNGMMELIDNDKGMLLDKKEGLFVTKPIKSSLTFSPLPPHNPSP